MALLTAWGVLLLLPLLLWQPQDGIILSAWLRPLYVTVAGPLTTAVLPLLLMLLVLLHEAVGGSSSSKKQWPPRPQQQQNGPQMGAIWRIAILPAPWSA